MPSPANVFALFTHQFTLVYFFKYEVFLVSSIVFNLNSWPMFSLEIL